MTANGALSLDHTIATCLFFSLFITNDMMCCEEAEGKGDVYPYCAENESIARFGIDFAWNVLRGHSKSMSPA